MRRIGIMLTLILLTLFFSNSALAGSMEEQFQSIIIQGVEQYIYSQEKYMIPVSMEKPTIIKKQDILDWTGTKRIYYRGGYAKVKVESKTDYQSKKTPLKIKKGDKVAVIVYFVAFFIIKTDKDELIGKVFKTLSHYVDHPLNEEKNKKMIDLIKKKDVRDMEFFK